MTSNVGIIYPDSQDKLQVLRGLVEGYVPLVKWGYKQSVQFPGTPRNPLAYAIYDSEACRVKFALDYSGNGRKLDLRVFYGRSHAPDGVSVMQWNGKDCYCWHNFEMALLFLDDISAEEAVRRRGSSPLGVQKFLELGLTGLIEQPEWLARMHATVWEYYGNRLFQLFDLRHPRAWNQFAQFVSDYYDILGRNPVHDPSLDQVC
jgi:hypothetical protein